MIVPFQNDVSSQWRIHARRPCRQICLAGAAEADLLHLVSTRRAKRVKWRGKLFFLIFFYTRKCQKMMVLPHRTWSPPKKAKKKQTRKAAPDEQETPKRGIWHRPQKRQGSSTKKHSVLWSYLMVLCWSSVGFCRFKHVKTTQNLNPCRVSKALLLHRTVSSHSDVPLFPGSNFLLFHLHQQTRGRAVPVPNFLPGIVASTLK